MITIITVGKIKEKYIREGIDDYLKRISKFTKIELIELEDESFDKAKTLKKEADKILKKINPKSFIVTLITHSNITFIIGGSYGLDDEIKKLSNYKLSFSKLTFPHQLFRLLFLEQLYRSYKIINNEEYHK